MSAPDNRTFHNNAPGVVVLIDEALIASVVETFYARVRRDCMLGPLFEATVEDWDAHLVTLRRFWSSVTLLTGAYKGTPLQAHLALPPLTHEHFQIWLRLFDETLATCCTPAQAEVFRSRATRIAESIRFAIARERGELPTTNDSRLAHPAAIQQERT